MAAIVTIENPDTSLPLHCDPQQPTHRRRRNRVPCLEA